MKAALNLFVREIAARRMILVASAAMGLVVLVLPWALPGRTAHPEEIRATAAVTVGLIWATLLAVGLGASCLARDLGENRLGFDFRLPVPGTTIWAARLLGAYVVVLLSGALVVGLAALAPIDLEGASGAIGLLTPWLDVDNPSPRAVVSILGTSAPLLLGLLLLAKNVGGLALFGDRRWTLLDLSSVATLALLVFFALDRLVTWDVSPWSGRVLLALATTLALGLLVATWRQVVGGRTEPARAHARASVFLAVAALAGGAAAEHAASRVVTPPRDALEPTFDGISLLTDRLLFVAAFEDPRDRGAFRFLLDPASGRTVRLGPAAGEFHGDPAVVADDGSVAVWVERPGGWRGDGPARLRTLSPASASGTVRDSPIEWTDPIQSWDLSPDGALVASCRRERNLGQGTIVIEDLRTGRVLRSLVPDDCLAPGWTRFSSPGVVSVQCSIWDRSHPNLAEARIDIDVETGAVERWERTVDELVAASATRTDAPPPSLQDFDDGGGFRGWRFQQAEGPEPSITLPAPPDVDPATAEAQVVSLPSGGVAILAGRGKDCRLLLFAADGTLRSETPFESAVRRRLLGPLASGSRVAVVHAPEMQVGDWEGVWSVDLLDAATGRVSRIAEAGRWLRGSKAAPRSIVLHVAGRGWLWLDPDTAEMKPVLGGAGRG